MILDCAGKPLDLTNPVVMGILNVTPDSFSDGGDYDRLDHAIARAVTMVEEGAAIIDVGGESTRPGAQAVNEQAELDRVIPVVERLVAEIDVPVSIDTSKALVMREAASAGAGMINDVCALTQHGALDAAAATALPVCLMHMQGEPRTMQVEPSYDDVVHEVSEFFTDRVEACDGVGIAHDKIVLDPGIGFGKQLAHNLTLLAHVDQLIELHELPVLIGASRKSMFGELLDAPVATRLAGGLAVAVLAAEQGASIFRVHDVKATVDALKTQQAIRAFRDS